MKLVLALVLIMFIVNSCSKNTASEGSKIAIYTLGSFDRVVDTTTYPATVRITNAVAEPSPLVQNSDILYYKASDYTFTLSRNVKPALANLDATDGFVVMVDDQPAYYGTFHPAYLSSILYGSATLDPFMADGNKLRIDFAMFSDAPALQSLDHRNDRALINALRSSGRLR